MIVKSRLAKVNSIWPIDENAGTPPQGWTGWPEDKRFAFVITHDVDTSRGMSQCKRLMDLDEALGFRSIFNIVPELYPVSKELLKEIKARGFGLGVHGLKHDGKLFRSLKDFENRAPRINHYLKAWDVKGFSSPSMHHNLKWMHKLDIEYSTSTFDTDPFEPQPDSVKTIFPVVISNPDNRPSFVEIPLTMAQDFTLFVLLQQKTTEIWERKIKWIAQRGGMAVINTHPDYMNFDNTKNRLFEYPVDLYAQFLRYVRSEFEGQYWHVLPSEIASYSLSALPSCDSDSITRQFPIQVN